MVFREQFGDDGQTGFLARFGQQLQASFSQALKFIGRRAGFECATAQDGGAGRLHGPGRVEQLLLALDRAGAGHDLDLPSADHHATRCNRGIGRVRLAADQLEAFLDRNDALDRLRELRDQALERFVRQFVADSPDHGPRNAPHNVWLVAEPFDFLEHGGFIFFPDPRSKNDNHGLGCGTALWLNKKSRRR